MTTLLGRQITDMIVLGQLDDQLEHIGHVVHERKKEVRRLGGVKVFKTLKKYNVVFLKDISPRYLQGLECTVTAIKAGNKVEVVVNEKDKFKARRYGYGTITINPSSIVVK